MDDILDFKKLPTMNGKASYCIDAVAWNTLIDYVKDLTTSLKDLSDNYTETVKLLTEAMSNLNKAQCTDRELLAKIFKYVKEGV